MKDGLLRCARNDAAVIPDTHLRIPAADSARVVHETPARNRAWGMPGAQCTRSLAWKNNNHTSVVTTGPPRSPGIPARNGFTGFLRALPGDRAFLSPSPCERRPVRARLGRQTSARLDAGVEASGPHDFTGPVSVV